MNYLEHLKTNKKIFFNFMKEGYPLFQHSNLFLRDLQYALKSYFDLKEKPINYKKAELLAKEFINDLSEGGELQKIDNKTWRVNFEVGIKPKVIETEEVINE